MASFEEGLFSSISTAPSLGGTKIYPMVLPDDAPLPAFTYMVVGGRSNPTLNTRGPQRWRVQIDAHSDIESGAALQAQGLRAALILLLDGWRGQMTNGPLITGCQFIQPVDYVDNDSRQFRCGAEFYFGFNL